VAVKGEDLSDLSLKAFKNGTQWSSYW